MGATAIFELGAKTPLTAFGETKTVAAWAEDERARAWTGLILERLAEGMSSEQAIALPVAVPGRRARGHLAFGEHKTLRDWADDPRCGVAYDTLKARVKAEWPLEQALTTPVQASGMRGEPELVKAWGEAKTIFDWALDPRCETAAQNIRMRLKAGYAPEYAIATPTAAHSTEKVAAFGEAKSLRAWARDPRAGATREAIRRRIANGMPVEEAITKPAMEMWEGGLTAFGEHKTLEAWAQDPRCVVSGSALGDRLKRGLAPEEALTRSHGFVRRLAPEVASAHGVPPHARLVTAFGETKSANRWGQDPRCSISCTHLVKRLEGGMEPEEAITTPSALLPRFLEAFGETKRVAHWASDPRCTVSASCLFQRINKGMPLEAAMTTPAERDWSREIFEVFGESKTLRDWSEDPRCAVSYTTLQSRLSNYGMAFAVALTSAPAVCRRGRYGEMAAAFGERRPLGEWMRDGRCVVSRKALGRRLRLGWELEKAMTTPERGDLPVNVQGRFVEAFGERKNMRQWGLDARCVVDLGTLKQRLGRDWEPQRALTTPPMPTDHLRGKHLPKRTQREATAFGETKALGLWARDPRCRVEHTTLAYRLGKGWDPERAIDTPQGSREAAPTARAPKGGLTAFGETKPLVAWAKDRRCGVPAAVVQARLDVGWSVEDALTVAMGVAVARAA